MQHRVISPRHYPYNVNRKLISHGNLQPNIRQRLQYELNYPVQYDISYNSNLINVA